MLMFLLRFWNWCLVENLKMKSYQDLCLNLWYDFKKLLWQDELNPRVRYAFGNVCISDSLSIVDADIQIHYWDIIWVIIIEICFPFPGSNFAAGGCFVFRAIAFQSKFHLRLDWSTMYVLKCGQSIHIFSEQGVLYFFLLLQQLLDQNFT